MSIIKSENISFRYTESYNNCLNNISIDINEKEMVALAGPNGAGKTTLFKIICGLIKGYAGNLYLYGKDINLYSNIELAKIISYIPQKDNYIFDFTVYEIIAMGRRPYLNSFGILSKKDKDIILNICDFLGINKIIKRKYSNLSGGEKRLVLIARALAQEASVLLMDEPTTYLDLYYKILFMDKLLELNKKGKTILLISHDINLISEYMNRVILIKEGKVIYDGKIKQVIDEKKLKEVFNFDNFIIEKNKVSGNPNLFFIPTNKTGG
jgi:iron complex transport system ATP-binding protein